MGARGPKADPNQAAKGFPGRRKAKAEAAAKAAARLAKVLAVRSAAAVDVPGFLRDPLFAPAAAIWRNLAPELRRTHRLPPESETEFMRFCIFSQEWFDATYDLHSNGFEQSVATIAGGTMERRRPKVFDRAQAHQGLRELSASFGMTPNDMYVLFKGQASVAVSNPGLFGDDRKGDPGLPLGAPEDGEAEAEPGAAARRVGGLGALRSAPPGERPN